MCAEGAAPLGARAGLERLLGRGGRLLRSDVVLVEEVAEEEEDGAHVGVVEGPAEDLREQNRNAP